MFGLSQMQSGMLLLGIVVTVLVAVDQWLKYQHRGGRPVKRHRSDGLTTRMPDLLAHIRVIMGEEVYQRVAFQKEGGGNAIQELLLAYQPYEEAIVANLQLLAGWQAMLKYEKGIQELIYLGFLSLMVDARSDLFDGATMSRASCAEAVQGALKEANKQLNQKFIMPIMSARGR